ncbi:hypothetical protein L861_14345 [Litchfieldella anticariensis FP35 = DSM 16096]|uniref:Tyr recombinase domain-containing protein n=1 Tax=Litchfieldella anticariensis (strain DSM 16096 / CECT 5854 / CIP 108499 / LMG 22089 / FP35) TaxID=1121939 RepID=S2KEZ3_LITA3|nr:site-specific integrase [Halomonas anticariensis]EPC00450.1 hypothetical protein L861_14345 [Halomonas anticariensis FP35 = DSM 16096]
MDIVDFDNLVQLYFSDRWLRPYTQRSYECPVRLFRRFIGEEVLPNEVTRHDVIRWRSEILRNEHHDGIAETSWNNYVRHLKAIFKHGIDNGYLPLMENPFSKVSVRPMRKPKKTVRKEHIALAREVIDLSIKFEEMSDGLASLHPAWFWEVVFETFYHTGIRMSQLLKVRVRDVSLETRILIATSEGAKNNNEHSVPISSGLYPHLLTLMSAAKSAKFKPGDQLFNVNRFSRRHRLELMDISQVAGFYRKLSRLCSVRMTPHRFRHTLGTDLMRNPDRNLHIVKALLGHMNISTTLEYIEADPESIRKQLDDR